MFAFIKRLFAPATIRVDIRCEKFADLQRAAGRFKDYVDMVMPSLIADAAKEARDRLPMPPE